MSRKSEAKSLRSTLAKSAGKLGHAPVVVLSHKPAAKVSKTVRAESKPAKSAKPIGKKVAVRKPADPAVAKATKLWTARLPKLIDQAKKLGADSIGHVPANDKEPGGMLIGGFGIVLAFGLKNDFVVFNVVQHYTPGTKDEDVEIIRTDSFTKAVKAAVKASAKLAVEDAVRVAKARKARAKKAKGDTKTKKPAVRKTVKQAKKPAVRKTVKAATKHVAFKRAKRTARRKH